MCGSFAMTEINDKAHYHLPGLFEFYELYKVFLPLFYEHREYFYEWCDIGSIYGAPRIVSGAGDVSVLGKRMRMRCMPFLRSTESLQDSRSAIHCLGRNICQTENATGYAVCLKIHKTVLSYIPIY